MDIFTVQWSFLLTFQELCLKADGFPNLYGFFFYKVIVPSNSESSRSSKWSVSSYTEIGRSTKELVEHLINIYLEHLRELHCKCWKSVDNISHHFSIRLLQTSTVWDMIYRLWISFCYSTDSASHSWHVWISVSWIDQFISSIYIRRLFLQLGY